MPAPFYGPWEPPIGPVTWEPDELFRPYIEGFVQLDPDWPPIPEKDYPEQEVTWYYPTNGTPIIWRSVGNPYSLGDELQGWQHAYGGTMIRFDKAGLTPTFPESSADPYLPPFEDWPEGAIDIDLDYDGWDARAGISSVQMIWTFVNIGLLDKAYFEVDVVSPVELRLYQADADDYDAATGLLPQAIKASDFAAQSPLLTQALPADQPLPLVVPLTFTGDEIRAAGPGLRLSWTFAEFIAGTQPPWPGGDGNGRELRAVVSDLTVTLSGPRYRFIYTKPVTQPPLRQVQRDDGQGLSAARQIQRSSLQRSGRHGPTPYR